jgi:hypothetical protein
LKVKSRADGFPLPLNFGRALPRDKKATPTVYPPGGIGACNVTGMGMGMGIGQSAAPRIA